MSVAPDWLSQLLEMITVTGRLEIRCAYGAPWRVVYEQSPAREIPYHIVLGGRAILEDPDDHSARELVAGDIVLLPHGSAHFLHDGSGRAPAPVDNRAGASFVVSENARTGERLDMLCGRFVIAPPHDRFIHDYLPTKLVARSADDHAGNTTAEPGAESSAAHLNSLVRLMRTESGSERLGGHAMLNTLSAALFTLVIRTASESEQAPTGLLALAGHPRLAPAIAAMFGDPARPWTLPELADLCSMSRATFMRHFQDKLGRSANDFLKDIRMGLAANELKRSALSVETVAELVGYQSVSAFRRVFTQWMKMTPAQWRQASRPDAAGTSEDDVSA